MENISEWAPTVVAVAAWLSLLWRFESRISGVENRLENRISDVENRLGERIARIEGTLEGFATKSDVARIEGLLEGYFMQGGKREEN